MAIAIDTETALASNAEPVPRLVSIAFAYGGDAAALLVPPLFAAHDRDWLRLLKAQLASGEPIVFANAPFDITVLERAAPELAPLFIAAYERGQIRDVLTREKLIDIAEGAHMKRGVYSLAAVAERRAEITLDKGEDTWRMRYIELLGMEIIDWPMAATEYAIKDATTTLATYEAQAKHAAQYSVDLFEDAHRQAMKHRPLYEQTLIGIDTDPEWVEEFDLQLGTQAAIYQAQLLAAGLARWGGTKKEPKIVCNTKIARAMLAEIVDPRLITMTDHPTNPQVSIGGAALEKAGIPDGHPLAVLRDMQAAKATRSRLIPVFRNPKVRTRYDECKDTGRTGSSGPQGKRKDLEPWEWIGTNLQNLPRGESDKQGKRIWGYRECLVPPPGHVFVITDVKGAELVSFAQIETDLFGGSKMADALRAGRDIHADLACDFLEIDYAQYDPANPLHKGKRQFSKPPGFGFLGGMGPVRMVGYAAGMGIRMTLDEAKHAKRVWLNKWQTKPYFDLHGKLQRESPTGKITIIQHRSNRVRGGCTFSEACNTNFQGLAIDALGDSLWQLWKAAGDPASPLFGCRQVLFAHDEHVTVAPIARADAVRVEQERIMIEAFTRWCPDVPTEMESQIVERYTK